MEMRESSDQQVDSFSPYEIACGEENEQTCRPCSRRQREVFGVHGFGYDDGGGTGGYTIDARTERSAYSNHAGSVAIGLTDARAGGAHIAECPWMTSGVP